MATLFATPPAAPPAAPPALPPGLPPGSRPRSLPGIRISATPPVAAQVLPRMDVAVLVGFASTGPLHRPVVVDSVGAYAAVFGPDAPLAWDARRGERVHAHLGPAVRAFFANGGRRCWVVRVARSAAAEALWRGIPLAQAQALPDVARCNQFAVPGVLQVRLAAPGGAAGTGTVDVSPPGLDGLDGPVAAARAQARCEGSWSDALRVACAIGLQPLVVNDLQALDSPPQAGWRLRSPQALQPGDLLQLGSTGVLCAYAMVQATRPADTPGEAPTAELQVLPAFERLGRVDGMPPSPALSGLVGAVDIHGLVGGPTNGLPALLVPAPGTDPAAALMQLQPLAPLPARTEPGHWARWQGGGHTVWLRIDTVDRAEAAGDASPPGSSPPVSPPFSPPVSPPLNLGSPPSPDSPDHTPWTGADPAWSDLTLSGPAWRELPDTLPPALATQPRVHRLLLDLRVQQAQQAWHLSGLGLAPQHPQAWWAHGTDEQQHARAAAVGTAAEFTNAGPGAAGTPSTTGTLAGDGAGAGAPAIRSQAAAASAAAPGSWAAPRFPLACSVGPAPTAWLPLGVDALFGAAPQALPHPATPLQRDGLSRLDAELFLDPALARTAMPSLLAQADAIRLLNEPVRDLLGLHATLGIGVGGISHEPSLLAVPDAVHLGWAPRGESPQPLPTAPLPPAPAHWRQHRGACTEAGAGHRQPTPCATHPPGAQPGTPSDPGCCGGPADTPAPDTPPLAEPDFSRFIDCRTRALPAPVLMGPAGPVPPGPVLLRWTAVEPGADLPTRYELWAARAADFADAQRVADGPLTQHHSAPQRSGRLLYRVRAWRGDEPSVPSNTVVVQVQQDDWLQHDPDALPPEAEATWLAVHRAALRLAGASGELLAVLGLPQHLRSAQAIAYAGRLRSVQAPRPGALTDPDALAHTEARALSFGALYHPWLQAGGVVADAGAGVGTGAGGPAGGGGLFGTTAAAAASTPQGRDGRPATRNGPRTMPPDGAALGVLAARALRRGAWVAPANEVFKDVLALAPAAPPADWQALQDAQINLLRADPRGLLCLSADTLALEPDADVRPIGVRRLLILLRRLALRHGTRYVFEPQGPVLRRAVQRSFQELLDTLFRRGAFAGRTPEQGFRIVTDAGLNRPRDRDAGRFFVELRVAPAQPLRFISVRLTQSGERLSVAETL